MLRILLYLTIGFASACALCAYRADSFIWILLAAALAVALALCQILRKKTAKALLVILIGAVFGYLWMSLYNWSYLEPLRAYHGQTVHTTITVTDYSHDTDYGISSDGRIRLGEKTYRIRFYGNGLDALSPGDRITCQMELQTVFGEETGETDYLSGLGIFLTGTVEADAVVEKAETLNWRHYPVALRKEILERLDQCFPADTLAFARALLLGDTRLITYEEDTAYIISGIRHVIAVSGLHISVLFSLIYMAAGKRRILTALIGIPVLVLFAAVAGFTPSVVRACIMQCLMILSLLLKKEYDPPTALAFSVLWMLIADPMAVTSVSLQLSVGSMAGIFLFCRRFHEWAMSGKIGQLAKGKDIWARILWWCVSSATVTLSAMSLTVPLSGYYFGTASLIGIVTNLLCLWMVSGIFYGIMLTCLVGAVSVTAGTAVAAVITVPIRLVKWISRCLSSFPLAAVYTCSEYIVLWLILCYCLLAVFLLSKKKKPALLVAGIVLSLALAVGASRIEPFAGNYLVTVMDVGQGQCVLLRCGERNYLVDCGGEHGKTVADKAANLLLSQGIIALDGIIVTHYDLDHANGVAYLMQRVPAAALYLPDAPDDSGMKKALADAYPERIGWVNTDIQMAADDWRITVFAGAPGKAGNESSLSVLFQRQNCDILIIGDRSVGMEDALLDRYTLPQLELLVVGHHGSSSSSGFRLLEETKPAYAAISVGADNRYGQPAPEALARLERAGCVILRTDRDGDIDFRR